MMSAAAGMPITSNAATYGESPSFASFHGRIVTSRKIEPTKKSRMRETTALVALAIAFSGFLDSAAAIVTISAPTIEKITTTIPLKIATAPLGANPPCAVRLLKLGPLSGHRPST